MSDSSIQTGGNLGPTPTEPNVASGIASTDMPKAGTPVYVLANGQLAIASANTQAAAQRVGLLLYGVSAGQRAFYKYAGPLQLTPAEVAALLDTGTSFTPGVVYYLSQQSGKLTLTPPSHAGGGYLSPVATASGPDTLNFGGFIAALA